MTTPLDNEKIAAYVLGELDGIEREVVEAVLEGDTETQRTAAGFRNAAQVLTEALAVALRPRIEHVTTGSRSRRCAGRRGRDKRPAEVSVERP